MSRTPRPGPSSASHAARRRRDGLTLLHRLAQQSQEPQTQAEPRVLSSTHGSFLPTDSEACMTSQPPGWRTRQHTESYFKRVAPVSAENYSDFSSPPPPHPAVRFKAAAEDPATVRSMGKCPSRPSDAPKCSGVGGCPKASSQSRSGRAQAARGTGLLPRSSEKYSLFPTLASPPLQPQPSQQGCPSLPAAVTGSPSLCSPESESILWASARPRIHHRPPAGRWGRRPGSGGRAAHSVWAAKSLEPGRCRVGSVWPDTRARGRLRRGQACSCGPPAARPCLHARVVGRGGGGSRRGTGMGRT